MINTAHAYCVKNAAGEWQMNPTTDPRLVGAAVDQLRLLDAQGEKVAKIVEADRTAFEPRWAGSFGGISGANGKQKRKK